MEEKEAKSIFGILELESRKFLLGTELFMVSLSLQVFAFAMEQDIGHPNLANFTDLLSN